MPKLRLDPDRLQPAFDALRVRVGPGRASAAVLAVATSDGLVREEAFGIEGGSVAVGDRFFLASITKPIVATAVVQLAAEGRISLGEPLRTYLPDLAETHATITTRHVLTHTSGIPDDAFGDWMDRTPRDELVRRAFTRPLAFLPGTRYAYCSASFYLLAELLARMDGVPFPESLRRRVLAPMGMTATSFSGLDPTGTPIAPVGMPGAPSAPGDAIATLEYLATIAIPGGGLWSTAADLVRFSRAYLCGGSLDGVRLLPSAYLDLMCTEHTRGVMELPVGGAGPGRDPGYGLGWGIAAKGGVIPCSSRAVEHGGASGTRLFIDPETDTAVVVLTNLWADAEASMSVLSAVHAALVLA
jgi:CubicO group peptidase (beta-lactamase class C family)